MENTRPKSWPYAPCCSTLFEKEKHLRRESTKENRTNNCSMMVLSRKKNLRKRKKHYWIYKVTKSTSSNLEVLYYAYSRYMFLHGN